MIYLQNTDGGTAIVDVSGQLQFSEPLGVLISWQRYSQSGNLDDSDDEGEQSDYDYGYEDQNRDEETDSVSNDQIRLE